MPRSKQLGCPLGSSFLQRFLFFFFSFFSFLSHILLTEEFVKMAPFQKVNYMPGTSQICRFDKASDPLNFIHQKVLYCLQIY